MNQQQWYSEKLDAFLKGQLSEQDTQNFNEVLDTDPLLKNEASLQKDIYEALCEARKSDLKARLNKINIEPYTPFYTLPRTALFGTLAIATLLTGFLVYFDISKNEKFVPKTQDKNIVVLPPAITPSPTITDNNPISHKEDEEFAIVSPIIVNTNLIKEEIDLVEIEKQVEEKVKAFEPEIVNLRLKNIPKKEPTIKNISPTIIVSESETHNLDKAPQAKVKNLRAIKNNKKENLTLAYQERGSDDDLGIFDGKNEPSLETMAEKNKLSYQYYNGKLFLIDPNVKGKEIHFSYKGKIRHFLLYEQEYFEFFDDRYEKTELQIVKESDLIDLLNKEIKK